MRGDGPSAFGVVNRVLQGGANHLLLPHGAADSSRITQDH
jgi:hypothetical protein